MERIVDRSDLYSAENSPVIYSDAETTFHVIPFDFVDQTAPDHHVKEEEDEMDFCLFAPAPGKKTCTEAQPTVSRIRLKSPSPNATLGLENPHRDGSYYFTNPLSPEQLQNLRLTAVSGPEVQVRSCTSCPGSSYAWKVQHIRATKREALLLAKACAVYDKGLNQEISKRKRPGKQARIKLRKNFALAKAAEEQHQRAAELKEAADREKRTRRNREKKMKKKIREKAKKASAGAVGAENEDVEAEASDASSAPD